MGKPAFGAVLLQSLMTNISPAISQMKVNFKDHPSFKEGDDVSLEMKLWTQLAEAGVLIAPGWMFSATGANLEEQEGHFRISFSNADVCLVSFIVPFHYI